MDLASKVLAEIDLEKIKPKSRLWFRFKNIAFWSLLVIGVLLGTIATSLLILSVHGVDPTMKGVGFQSISLGTLPYFLAASGVLFVGMGLWAYRRTRFGYRRQFWKVILLMILLVSVLGGITFWSNGTFIVHRAMMQWIPPYRAMLIGHQKQLWTSPQNGRLSGVIVELDWDHIQIQDWQGKRWWIDDADADWRLVNTRKAGTPIKIWGSLQGENSFQAMVILPWMNATNAKMHQEKLLSH